MTADLTAVAHRAVLLTAATASATALLALTLAAVAGPTDLELSYPPPTGRLQDAAAIFANNVRVALLIAGATLLAPILGPGARVLSVVLAVVLAGNLTLIAGVLASDGIRAVHALWAHLPCEIAAYSVAVAVYQRTRAHGPPARQTGAVAATLVLGLLALGAVLEVTPL
jgi:hypothetical protein